MRDDLIIEDTTLRDGEQSPGVAFDPQTKLKIHDALVDAGVRWMEVGIPAMGGDELDFIRRLLDRGSAATLVGWNRGVRADVEQSLDLGFHAIHIGLPTSDVHLASSVNRDRAWLLRSAVELVHLAKDRGAFVSISAEDVGRTELGFLQEYAGVVADAGADRLRLSDTIGILDPSGYAARVSAVREAASIDLQCHAHNDFGLATANTLAGLQAGARYFHVTVNGIGERAGMADLAQVVVALHTLHGVDVGVDLAKLVDLSALLSGTLGQTPPPWQPVVGRNVFAHESGIHANGMLKDGSTFEPIAPELVGGTRRLVIGKHSGRAALAHHLEAQGTTDVDEHLPALLDLVRLEATRTGTEVSPDRLVTLLHLVREGARVAG